MRLPLPMYLAWDSTSTMWCAGWLHVYIFVPMFWVMWAGGSSWCLSGLFVSETTVLAGHFTSIHTHWLGTRETSLLKAMASTASVSLSYYPAHLISPFIVNSNWKFLFAHVFTLQTERNQKKTQPLMVAFGIRCEDSKPSWIPNWPRYVRRWLADERQGRLSNPEALVEEAAESQGDANFKVS